MEKSKIKINLITATYAIVLYLFLTNFKNLTGTLDGFFKIITPFIYGFVIAYLLKGPYHFFEKRLSASKPNDSSDSSTIYKFRKPLSLLCVYISFILFIVIIFSIVVPQLVTSVNALISNLPEYSKSLEIFITKVLDNFNVSNTFWEQFENMWRESLQTVAKLITTGLPRVLDIAMNITSSISNIVIGFVVSIYMLSSKDKLRIQFKKLLYAFIPSKYVEKTLKIVHLTDKTFGGFITGQLTDAFIVGVICYIGMSIFKFPYALLISVIIGLTNIIPIFGPIIGCVPGTFIILMVDPIKALWFIIFIIILQQIDGNIICPRILGESIGLSGLWVMFAILVGGGLFGLMGMVIGVPTFAVVYTLLREATNARLIHMDGSTCDNISSKANLTK